MELGQAPDARNNSSTSFCYFNVHLGLFPSCSIRWNRKKKHLMLINCPSIFLVHSSALYVEWYQVKSKENNSLQKRGKPYHHQHYPNKCPAKNSTRNSRKSMEVKSKLKSFPNIISSSTPPYFCSWVLLSCFQGTSKVECTKVVFEVPNTKNCKSSLFV